MTPEEKQQLDQVIKRHNQQPPSTSTITCWNDVDFLLSLVKEQEAGNKNPVGWISCGLRRGRDRIVDIVFENATCAKEFIDGVEPVTGPIIAATSMRSACVEKVRALAQRYRDNGDKSAWKALVAAIGEIESLTLQEQEAKQS